MKRPEVFQWPPTKNCECAAHPAGPNTSCRPRPWVARSGALNVTRRSALRIRELIPIGSLPHPSPMHRVLPLLSLLRRSANTNDFLPKRTFCAGYPRRMTRPVMNGGKSEGKKAGDWRQETEARSTKAENPLLTPVSCLLSPPDPFCFLVKTAKAARKRPSILGA